MCPVFSPDGTRLAYGQSTGNQLSGFGDFVYPDGDLVIVDVSADGVASGTMTIALDGMDRPPCATWSADGRWLAFGAGTVNRTDAHPPSIEEIWMVDTETTDVRHLPGLSGVTDIEWAPDATELYIANDGRISMYSVAADQTREVPRLPSYGESSFGFNRRVEYIAVSPDGRSLAVQTSYLTQSSPGAPRAIDLTLLDIRETGDQKGLFWLGIIAQEFDQTHGIGPVWSPDSEHIAYQRVCGHTPDNQTCGEQHEIVVVTINKDDLLRQLDATLGKVDRPAVLEPPYSTQVVIPPPETTALDGTRQLWWPFTVTWSPDGTILLYNAWAGALPAGSEMHSLLAVPMDGATPPIVLRDDLEISPYDGILRLPLQIWSRQQG
jgi:Tol biopolymer transport system component